MQNLDPSSTPAWGCGSLLPTQPLRAAQARGRAGWEVCFGTLERQDRRPEGSSRHPWKRERLGGYLGALVEIIDGPCAHEGELQVRVRVDAAWQDELAPRVDDPQPGVRAPRRQQVATESLHHAVLHQHVGHLREVVVDHATPADQEPRRRRHGRGRTSWLAWASWGRPSPRAVPSLRLGLQTAASPEPRSPGPVYQLGSGCGLHPQEGWAGARRLGQDRRTEVLT